jgi:hypothetical protein
MSDLKKAIEEAHDEADAVISKSKSRVTKWLTTEAIRLSRGQVIMVGLIFIFIAII